MDADALLSVLNTSALREPAIGAGLLGLVAGSVGAFAVLRRQSLQGDVVSHAALPGLGGELAVFFGLGLALLTHIQRTPGGAASPLERYLFGQAAWIGGGDLKAIGGLGAAALAVLGAFWKELKLLSFDPDYAASLGLPVRGLDLLLTTLTVVAVVIGLKAVGVVLMTALLVAPAAAARQWTDRLGRVVLLAGALGAISGVAGTVASHLLSTPRATVPTGPTIVLCATLLVVASLLFGTARGLARGSRARPRLVASRSR